MFIIATFYRFANTKTENLRIILHTIRTKCKLASAYLCCFCQKKKQERLRKALLFCEIIYIFSINLISISGTRIWRDGRRVSAVFSSRCIACAVAGICSGRMGNRLLGSCCHTPNHSIVKILSYLFEMRIYFKFVIFSLNILSFTCFCIIKLI